MTDNNLSEAQQHILDSIVGFVKEHGRSPSIPELAEVVQKKEATVYYHVKRLGGKGRIVLSLVNHRALIKVVGMNHNLCIEGDLTPAQRETLDAIVQFVKEKRYSPSYKDLVKIAGLKSPSPVQARLRQLQEKGYIKIDPRVARSIQVLKMAG